MILIYELAVSTQSQVREIQKKYQKLGFSKIEFTSAPITGEGTESPSQRQIESIQSKRMQIDKTIDLNLAPWPPA